MRRLRSTLGFLGALVATNVKAAYAQRASFWMQVALMIANDLLWLSVWWIFFRRFETLGGWRLPDLVRLYAVIACGFGIAVVLGTGARDLSRAIADGDLDVFLTQPRSALLHVVASRTSVSGLGDLATGIGLLALAGDLTLGGWFLAVLAALCSATALVALAVLLHSLAFWAGRIDGFAHQAWEFVLTFAFYPDSLFLGALRAALFTVVPAAFVGWVPARLLHDPSLGTVALAVGGSAAVAAAAAFVFRRGLARYTSGSRVTVRT